MGKRAEFTPRKKVSNFQVSQQVLSMTVVYQTFFSVFLSNAL